MEKFTKTTEIDISNMKTVEDETPQKSKIGKIIAVMVSLLLAVSIWLYVMETDETIIEKEYSDIYVEIINIPEEFNITSKVTLSGTNSQLIDIDPSQIKVFLDASRIDSVGKFDVSQNASITDGNGVSISDVAVKVEITVVEKK